MVRERQWEVIENGKGKRYQGRFAVCGFPLWFDFVDFEPLRGIFYFKGFRKLDLVT